MRHIQTLKITGEAEAEIGPADKFSSAFSTGKSTFLESSQTQVEASRLDGNSTRLRYEIAGKIYWPWK